MELQISAAFGRPREKQESLQGSDAPNPRFGTDVQQDVPAKKTMDFPSKDFITADRFLQEQETPDRRELFLTSAHEPGRP